ncbi:TetR/AcrR family transcriptional regulator [Spirosoma sp. KUDC1026]|uniref:TetR/AcrR family transcriptional regulator n=1 Tax=Spirosoma sp. KUDC1026 TaxID=2745947 RepID=UPI00159B87AA|nr:TetR/AcrR family transcriptional regulator [Spirosoma sp. KUDC1026]QKZ15337.1 TetR/AcrR family transcriptional regulator [Spirosoma sp. KUDC1026]
MVLIRFNVFTPVFPKGVKKKQDLKNTYLTKEPYGRFLCKVSMENSNNYKRKKEPQENRQLILEAATDIINRKGIESMSLDAVARMANLSKGGLMHHFPKKEALIDELFQNRLDQFTQAFKQELALNRSSAIAFLKTVVNEEFDEQQKRSLNVMTQACFNSEYYRQLFSQWYREHVIADPNDTSVANLTAILVADSLLLSNVFEFYQISSEQKQRLVAYLEKLERDL